MPTEEELALIAGLNKGLGVTPGSADPAAILAGIAGGFAFNISSVTGTVGTLINYHVTDGENQTIFKLETYKGAKETITISYTGWAVDGGDITAVTWAVLQGKAVVSDVGLNTNVTSAQITTDNAGPSLIKIVVVAGSNTYVQYLEVIAKNLA